MMYIKTQFGDFEWDEKKNHANFEKHGLKFEEAIYVFTGLTYTYESEASYDEIREVTIGTIQKVLITTVVHTQRGKATRIISARPAKRKERARYAAFIESNNREAESII